MAPRWAISDHRRKGKPGKPGKFKGRRGQPIVRKRRRNHILWDDDYHSYDMRAIFAEQRAAASASASASVGIGAGDRGTVEIEEIMEICREMLQPLVVEQWRDPEASRRGDGEGRGRDGNYYLAGGGGGLGSSSGGESSSNSSSSSSGAGTFTPEDLIRDLRARQKLSRRERQDAGLVHVQNSTLLFLAAALEPPVPHSVKSGDGDTAARQRPGPWPASSSASELTLHGEVLSHADRRRWAEELCAMAMPELWDWTPERLGASMDSMDDGGRAAGGAKKGRSKETKQAARERSHAELVAKNAASGRLDLSTLPQLVAEPAAVAPATRLWLRSLASSPGLLRDLLNNASSPLSLSPVLSGSATLTVVCPPPPPPSSTGPTCAIPATARMLGGEGERDAHRYAHTTTNTKFVNAGANDWACDSNGALWSFFSSNPHSRIARDRQAEIRSVTGFRHAKVAFARRNGFAWGHWDVEEKQHEQQEEEQEQEQEDAFPALVVGDGECIEEISLEDPLLYLLREDTTALPAFSAMVRDSFLDGVATFVAEDAKAGQALGNETRPELRTIVGGTGRKVTLEVSFKKAAAISRGGEGRT